VLGVNMLERFVGREIWVVGKQEPPREKVRRRLPSNGHSQETVVSVNAGLCEYGGALEKPLDEKIQHQPIFGNAKRYVPPGIGHGVAKVLQTGQKLLEVRHGRDERPLSAAC